ncbi:MAG: response regulator transcription factor [Neisseria sp.]|nr:response regulator transcription factor [Neisseria sp.]
MRNVLLVNDNSALTQALSDYLRAQNWQVTTVSTAADGLREAGSGSYDIVILDDILPDMSGLDMLKKIRKKGAQPVIIFSEREDNIDRIIGLELGADDYFSYDSHDSNPRELVARINTVLRRSQRAAPSPAAVNTDNLHIGSIALYPEKRQVLLDNQPVALTGAEFNLAEMLIRNAGRVVSKSELAVHALGKKPTKFDRSVDVHISSIRKKLGNPALIQTVRGVGYFFVKG